MRATITLEKFTYILAQGSETRVEPYLWPFLLGVGTRPLDYKTYPDAALLGQSRQIVGSSMKPGDSATLEFPANTVTVESPNQLDWTLILVVAVLDADESTETEMQAGYQAYLDELTNQLDFSQLQALVQAYNDAQAGNPQPLDDLIAAIQKAVGDKVYSAVRNAMSGYRKTKAYLGFLDTDDQQGAFFKVFRNAQRLTATAFSDNVDRTDTHWAYAIDGTLRIEKSPAEACLVEEDDARQAADRLAVAQANLTRVKAEDSGPRSVQLALARAAVALAEEAVQRTQRALKLCRLTREHVPLESVEELEVG